MENSIITDDDLNKTISERSEYFNTKSIYFSELEMNTEYDESISFNHFFSIYQAILHVFLQICEIKKKY